MPFAFTGLDPGKWLFFQLNRGQRPVQERCIAVTIAGKLIAVAFAVSRV